ncbi:hypothetical protein BC832DRAFT_485345 [Gaertneriomyces semiglobifer]|nr:hypothetical protein BC832DRAFT_485345 [Gaertneriomyces semiglobifer]
MDTTASTEVPAAGGPPASELTSTSTTGRFSCLENVANFRDVGENYNDDCKRGSPILRTKNLYRSARLDSASTTDVRTLVEEYGVKTVIDLRSDLERKECDHVASTFLVAAIEEEMKEELAPLTPSSNSECFQAEALQRAFPDNATSVAKRQRTVKQESHRLTCSWTEACSSSHHWTRLYQP